MSNLLNNTPRRYLSFKEFLTEVNYGSLEKDKRLYDVRMQLYDSIRFNLTHNPDIDNLKGIVECSFFSKYRFPKEVSFKIYWKIETFKLLSGKRSFLCKNAYTSQRRKENQFNLVIECLRNTSESNKDYIQEILYFLNKDFDVVALHEIKHMIDAVDKVTHKSTYQDVSDVPSKKEMTKYISQDQERHNFLISVISELKMIKEEEPEITYQQAINKSPMYKQFFAFLEHKYVSKMKNKIHHFWYDTYEKN